MPFKVYCWVHNWWAVHFYWNSPMAVHWGQQGLYYIMCRNDICKISAMIFAIWRFPQGKGLFECSSCSHRSTPGQVFAKSVVLVQGVPCQQFWPGKGDRKRHATPPPILTPPQPNPSTPTALPPWTTSCSLVHIFSIFCIHSLKWCTFALKYKAT